MTPSQKRHLAEQSAWRLLEHRLSDFPAVKEFSTPDWDEPSTLVHSLLPRLLAPNMDESSIEDVLYDITEELRHVLYHIQDPKFFRHLVDKRSPDAK
jgi:hypothetical protein